MVTKAEVIELYLSKKIESEMLLQLMKDIDSDNPKFQENYKGIQAHIALIDLVIYKINRGLSQESLNHFFNVALSWRIDSN